MTGWAPDRAPHSLLDVLHITAGCWFQYQVHLETTSQAAGQTDHNNKPDSCRYKGGRGRVPSVTLYHWRSSKYSERWFTVHIHYNLIKSIAIKKIHTYMIWNRNRVEAVLASCLCLAITSQDFGYLWTNKQIISVFLILCWCLQSFRNVQVNNLNSYQLQMSLYSNILK